MVENNSNRMCCQLEQNGLVGKNEAKVKRLKAGDDAESEIRARVKVLEGCPVVQ